MGRYPGSAECSIKLEAWVIGGPVPWQRRVFSKIRGRPIKVLPILKEAPGYCPETDARSGALWPTRVDAK